MVSPGTRNHRFISRPDVTDKHKPTPWLRPNQIKKFDGLNAIHAIMTTIKYGAGNGEKKYIDSLWIMTLEQVRRWPSVLWDGVPASDVPRLLDFAVNRYNTEEKRQGDLPNLSVEKVSGIPDTSITAALTYLGGVLERDVSFALVRTDVPWPHWFVLQYLTVLSNKVRFYALDDYGLIQGVQETTGFKAKMADINLKAVRTDRLFDTSNVYRITRIQR